MFVKLRQVKKEYEARRLIMILTGKYTAIPCFVAIMLAIFFLTFNVIGAFLQNVLQMGIDALTGVV